MYQRRLHVPHDKADTTFLKFLSFDPIFSLQGATRYQSVLPLPALASDSSSPPRTLWPSASTATATGSISSSTNTREAQSINTLLVRHWKGFLINWYWQGRHFITPWCQIESHIVYASSHNCSRVTFNRVTTFSVKCLRKVRMKMRDLSLFWPT